MEKAGKEEFIINKKFFAQNIKELIKVYGRKNIVIHKDKKYVLIRNFKLPPGYKLKYTDVIIEIPDMFGYNIPATNIYILTILELLHLSSAWVKPEVISFYKLAGNKFRRVILKILEKLTFGIIKPRICWVCMHLKDLRVCPFLEHLSILYIALERIIKGDKELIMQLNSMRELYQTTMMEIEKRRIKVKKKLLLRLPFPSVKLFPENI